MTTDPSPRLGPDRGLWDFLQANLGVGDVPPEAPEAVLQNLAAQLRQLEQHSASYASALRPGSTSDPLTDGRLAELDGRFDALVGAVRRLRQQYAYARLTRAATSSRENQFQDAGSELHQASEQAQADVLIPLALVLQQRLAEWGGALVDLDDAVSRIDRAIVRRARVVRGRLNRVLPALTRLQGQAHEARHQLERIWKQSGKQRKQMERRIAALQASIPAIAQAIDVQEQKREELTDFRDRLVSIERWNQKRGLLLNACRHLAEIVGQEPAVEQDIPAAIADLAKQLTTWLDQTPSTPLTGPDIDALPQTLREWEDAADQESTEHEKIERACKKLARSVTRIRREMHRWRVQRYAWAVTAVLGGAREVRNLNRELKRTIDRE
jgi:DNA repair exonuclease SbcCD ATPase subunit